VRRLLVLVALAPILMAETCGEQNACNQVPPGVGAIVNEAEAATDPCAGQNENHVLAWYMQGGIRYPLRCGRHDPSGWGYLHIRDDSPSEGASGHGDPVNDPAFSAEIAATLAQGVEALQGGGNWRYTVKYNDTKAICLNAWGFRVVLAKQPPKPDGHPAGIITAFRYSSQPARYP
jgi:hypothetical protein